ncbi:MAG: AI-2E family transporter [Pseudonocardiales bacterium]|nr:MAG: AI-2E family transporter [Pseudonocardiales bacterium]
MSQGGGEDQRAADAAGRAEAASVTATAAAEAAQDSAEAAEQFAEEAEIAEEWAEQIEAELDPLIDESVRQHEAGVDDGNPLGTLGRPLRRSPFVLGFTFALGAILAYVLYSSIVTVASVLILIVIAAFLAIGLHPTVSRLERLGLRRGMAVALVFLLVISFFVGVGVAIVPPIVNQVGGLIDNAPDYLTNLRSNGTFHSLDKRFHIVQHATDGVSSIGTKAAGGVLGVGKVVLSGVFNTLTVLILTLYFVSAFDRIKDGGYRLVPRSRRARAALIGDEILNGVGGYVAGALGIAFIAGAATLIWAAALGVPYPLALALVVAVTDLIPLVGATIGAVMVTIVAFFVSWPVGVATLVFYIVYQQVENYVIYPRMMKRSVDVSPAAAIVAVLIGGSLLGIVGALLAIPICAAVQLLMKEVVIPRQDAA